MCGGGVRIILLLSRDNRYMYMFFYVCCVAAIVKDSELFSLGVLKYVCVRDVMFSVSCLVCILWQFSLLHSA